MSIEYSLDQRLYRLNLSKKDFHEICREKGLKLSLGAIRSVLSNPGEANPRKVDLIKGVLSDIEAKRGITDIYFDRR